MAELTVVSHPQRERIDAMILGGLSLRKIAEAVSPPVSRAALHRYKTAETAGRRRETTETVTAKAISISDLQTGQQPRQGDTIPPKPSTLRALVDRLADRQERALDRAEAAVRVVEKDGQLLPVGEDLKVLAPMFRERLNCIRTLGELTGELNQAAALSPNITINIVASTAAPAASQPYDLELEATEEIATNEP